MKKLAVGVVAVLLTGAIVSAQAPPRLYTQPPVPRPETLDRLNLKLAWRAYLPTEGRRDGIFSVQIPERMQPPGELLLVQTRSSAVLALDSATGAILWRTRVSAWVTIPNKSLWPTVLSSTP